MVNRYSLIGLVLLAGCSDPVQDSASAENVARPIAWFHPTLVEASEQRQLTGVTHVATQAELSFEVSGKVKRVLIDVGERVEAGQVLALLDDTDASLTLNQRQSELREANALLVEAQQAFERQSVLRQRNVVGQAELDEATAKLDSSLSRVSVAEARVAQAEKGVADTRLKAPYGGVIAHRKIEASQQVAALSPVFTIHGLDDQMEVKVRIPETLVGRVDVGSMQSVSIPGMTIESVPATLSEVSGMTDNSNSFMATLSFRNDQGYIRDGLTAVATLSYPRVVSEDLDGWYLPNGSYIVTQDDKVMVFRYSEEHQVVDAIELDVIALKEGGIVVQGALKQVDYLALKGVSFLSSGQQVSLLERDVRRFNP